MPLLTSPSRLVNLRIHPIKSLDPVYLNECPIGPSGGLEFDRAWALYSVDGKWVNGKRTPAIHLIRAVYSDDLRAVTLSTPGDARQIPARTFSFPDAYEDASEWFSVFFDQQIVVRYSPDGFQDDPVANGPTLVSTDSLRAVCEWFPQITLEEARRRFRTNLEIDLASHESGTNTNSCMPFWEDQLFGENERSVVRFKIGDVHLEGSNPCARCPVPPRNPYTGANLDGFQKRFAQLREATLPAWSPRERFDHFYRFAVNTRIAPSETKKLLRLNDPLTIL